MHHELNDYVAPKPANMAKNKMAYRHNLTIS